MKLVKVRILVKDSYRVLLTYLRAVPQHLVSCDEHF